MKCLGCNEDLGVCGSKKRWCATCMRRRKTAQQRESYWRSAKRRKRYVDYASRRQKTTAAKEVRHRYNLALQRERNEAERLRRKNNPQRFSHYERLRHYGLTPAQFQSMREAQHGRCAICGIRESKAVKGRLCVDHDHASNEVRQLLCGKCNLLLGYCDEKIPVLLAAAEYLHQWKPRRRRQGHREP